LLIESENVKQLLLESLYKAHRLAAAEKFGAISLSKTVTIEQIAKGNVRQTHGGFARSTAQSVIIQPSGTFTALVSYN